jgi:hypothetical protein
MLAALHAGADLSVSTWLLHAVLHAVAGGA